MVRFQVFRLPTVPALVAVPFLRHLRQLHPGVPRPFHVLSLVPARPSVQRFQSRLLTVRTRTGIGQTATPDTALLHPLPLITTVRTLASCHDVDLSHDGVRTVALSGCLAGTRQCLCGCVEMGMRRGSRRPRTTLIYPPPKHGERTRRHSSIPTNTPSSCITPNTTT